MAKKTKRLYVYHFTTNPEVVDERGGNFYVTSTRVREDDDEFFSVAYDYITKDIVDNTEYGVLNESWNTEINYTYYSKYNSKAKMQEFKNAVKEALLDKLVKLHNEQTNLVKLIGGIK